MSDNIAKIAGYTKEITVQYQDQDQDIQVLIRPDTDLYASFKAWDIDMQEWIYVSGWMGSFE